MMIATSHCASVRCWTSWKKTHPAHLLLTSSPNVCFFWLMLFYHRHPWWAFSILLNLKDPGPTVKMGDKFLAPLLVDGCNRITPNRPSWIYSYTFEISLGFKTKAGQIPDISLTQKRNQCVWHSCKKKNFTTGFWSPDLFLGEADWRTTNCCYGGLKEVVKDQDQPS